MGGAVREAGALGPAVLPTWKKGLTQQVPRNRRRGRSDRSWDQGPDQSRLPVCWDRIGSRSRIDPKSRGGIDLRLPDEIPETELKIGPTVSGLSKVLTGVPGEGPGFWFSTSGPRSG